jgi:hypothetical protein
VVDVASLIFDYAKGRWVEKFRLPVGGDNIIVVLLQSSGLQSDTNINNHQTLADLLAAGNAEAGFTNYARKVLSAADITVTVNTGTNVTTVDTVDQVWNAAGGAANNTLGAILTCYRPTSGSLDSAILPLTKHDFATTTTGGNLTAQVPSIGTVT